MDAKLQKNFGLSAFLEIVRSSSHKDMMCVVCMQHINSISQLHWPMLFIDKYMMQKGETLELMVHIELSDVEIEDKNCLFKAE